MTEVVQLNKEVNPRFEEFLFDWNQKFQFLVGGYGSSKSYHVALKIILKLISEKRKALVVREVFETIRDSCFSLFEEIIYDLELNTKGVRLTTSPMKITFPNGSQIIFKGMDKPGKLKSINDISLIWLEECSEIKYAGFKELIGRLRHPRLRNYMILSTNPVSKSNWTYLHFFINKDAKVIKLDDYRLYNEKTIVLGDTYYHHSTADDNYFLPDDYIAQLDDMKNYDIDLHRVARLGQFGANGKKVLPQFEVMAHDEVMKVVNRTSARLLKNGLDFGFVTSFNALSRMAIDEKNMWLYIYDEVYTKEQDDEELYQELAHLGRTLIKADHEDSTIKYLNKKGMNLRKAKKYAGSRAEYTKKVKRFKRIICSDKCVNHIDELQDLTYKTNNNDEIIEDQFNIDPHTFSAMWYGLDDYDVAVPKGDYIRQQSAW
ncbi:PBSX family phage terminase large subunit [Macrococcoides caseolyticum]|uniref:PBSX family phage terminase large subunit n=1 Tax=Macrococcoides caseolyticum TaxID=69966 RepID=UPI00105BBD89|nr:PBSX family phage terminase large subunit [Macrococcus caseolyticus]TDM18867.1 PBSX family phage terminase large subunit [Macrococcus caseolyticus]